MNKVKNIKFHLTWKGNGCVNYNGSNVTKTLKKSGVDIPYHEVNGKNVPCENVMFGSEMSDNYEQRVWKALEQAQLSEYVKSLPKGIDTMVGERGIKCGKNPKDFCHLYSECYPQRSRKIRYTDGICT